METFKGNPVTRRRAGDGHQFVKLSDAQCDEIRRDYSYGKGLELARKYGVAKCTITSIASGRTRTIKPIDLPAPTLEVLRERKSRQYHADPVLAAAKRNAHRIANRDHVNALRRARHKLKDLDAVNAKRREHLKANRDRINARRRELARLKREAAANG